MIKMIKDHFNKELRELISAEEWLIVREEYMPEENLAYESLFGLANGRMGNRAAFEEGGNKKTLPANYIHGVFDKSEAFMRELANTPNWLELKMYYLREPFGIEDNQELNDFISVLDMKKGILFRSYTVITESGRKTKIEKMKFLSRANSYLGAVRTYITPLNYGGLFEFENRIDGTVTNFADFPRFRVKHLDTLEINDLEAEGAFLKSETRDFGMEIGTAAVVDVKNLAGEDILKSKQFRAFGEIACEFFDLELQKKETVVIDKLAAVCTERDQEDVYQACLKNIKEFKQQGLDSELAEHIKEYQKMWSKADLILEGDQKMQQAIRYNIFQLMSTPNPDDNQTNVGAKLLHGEEYGGHAFWDTELFVLPFFNWTFPEIAKNLVEYRYNLLDKAKENARENGYRGAKYPWESADTGDEECPAWTIEPDGTCYRCYVADYEHHVTAAVTLGMANYVKVTGDQRFMKEKGIHILLETAKFWVSRFSYNQEKKRYEILKVTGPDEWHEPVDNNAYTNHLAKWNIDFALEKLKEYRKAEPALYQKLCQQYGIDQKLIKCWQQLSEKIYTVADQGLIEQFEGYFELECETINEWDQNKMPLMPESLKGKDKNEICILKQADVVMLMFLMDDKFDLETQQTNFDYYEKRTLHRSSLSPSIHCMMGLRVGDDQRAYDYLERSAYVDLDNNQGNTREGIHAASAGGSWQSVVLGYCGMKIDPDGVLSFEPKLLAKWSRVKYSISWQGEILDIEVFEDDLKVSRRSSTDGQKIRYRVNGRERIIN
ncbi:kojibiose phosphorylase [Halanaerobium sp. ST460_2HS_T2]|nr:kojibiose phosphorylase [Halanaerobium sp. ST460_2HS_T2]